MPFSTAHPSSSASSSFHSRPAPVPIVLRGPEKDSRRYITELPRTLDGLLLKARSLFPVPPDNTPYITLDVDDQTVILEDAIPFLREREVLVFRWSPETPRKCSGNRVKWDESVGASTKSVTHSHAQTSTSSSASTSASESALAPPPPRSFSAIHQHQQRTQAHLHRAAHVKRVLEEQRRQREQELEQEQEQEQEEQHRLQQAQSHVDDVLHTVPVSDAAQDQPEPVLAQQPEEVNQSSDMPPSQPTIFMSAMTQSDLEVSGSSPPPYSSPHAPTTTTTTTAPVSGDRCTTPEQDHDSGSDGGPPSSPLVSSPTRDVHAAVLKTSMSPHGADQLVAGRSPDCVRPIVVEEEQDGADVNGDQADEDENVQPTSNDEDTAEARAPAEDEAMNSDDELECNDLLQSTPPQIVSPLRELSADKEVSPPTTQSPPCTSDKLYRTMSAVITNLQNHPSNESLRDGLSAEFHSFAQESGDGAIDLQILSKKLEQREYGTGQDALGLFRNDLKTLWTLVRDFYGPRSAQGQCATVLEKFAEVVLNEWKGRSGDARRVAVPSQPPAGLKRKLLSNSKDDVNSSAAARQRAAAVMASLQQQQGRRAKAAKRARPSAGKVGTGGGNGNTLDWPDMMAFHRAIMGGDEKQMNKVQQIEQVQPVVETVTPVQVIPEKSDSTMLAVPPRQHQDGGDSDDELSSAPPSPAPVQSSIPTTAAEAASKAGKTTTKTTTASSRGRRGSRRASRLPRRYAGEGAVQ